MAEVTRNLCAQIPVSLHSRIRQEQEASGQTLSAYMTQLITNYYHMKEDKESMNTETRTVAFQVPPELFEKFYLEAAAAGDEVVGIFLSHELSGTCQCARLAADMANVDNVLFVDSENVCLGESLLVRLAVQLRDAGKTAGQIAATLEHAKEHLHLVAVIDDLKYLRKGGRLPAAVAVAGGMLGIKPLITIKEGKVVMAGKARGLPGAYVALFKKIEELGGISTCADALAGYTLAPREVQPIQTYLQENLGRNEALVRQIGCVIGTHAGPGAFGLAFLDEGFTF